MFQPIVQYISVKAEPPSLGDNTADADRLRRAVGLALDAPQPVIPWSRLARVATDFRQAGFRGVAVVNEIPGGFEIVDFLAARPKVLAAMALDLGTTHLEATLVDLLSGDCLARANQENGQICFGADILSRMHFAAKNDGLEQLNRAVLESINGLAKELAVLAGLERSEIRAISVSGNPSMVHFFLKLDTFNICREPYIPVVNFPDQCRAGELGLDIHPDGPVFLLPGVGSYFGGDLISGILATGLDQAEQTSMLIDVGTNAEVVLGNREWLIACAGAAGPALEGGVARMGMRAGPGAIEHVQVDPQTGAITYQTIGEAKPRGICGSGIIDLVAGLYLARIIDIRGKFRRSAAGSQLTETPSGLAFTVVPASQGADRRPVVLGQVDLDALIRSKAAMYSILTTLVNQVGVSFEELGCINVAGAFGRHIDPAQAVTLGMLPDLPLATYQPVGNSSLGGAEKVLLERGARQRCKHIATTITYIELNVNQEFMMRFSGAKFIPHTERQLFPSVPVFE